MQQLNILKKVLLFLNASAIRLASLWNRKNSFIDQIGGDALIINFCSFFFLYKIFSIFVIHIPWTIGKFLLVVPLIFSAGISFIFPTELKIIEKNYKDIYSTPLYIIYSVFTISGVLYTLYFTFLLLNK